MDAGFFLSAKIIIGAAKKIKIQFVKNMCATGAAISKLIIVRSRKRIKSSGRLTGIFEPRISPPTSER